VKKTDEHKLATKVANLTADIADALAADDDYRATRLMESAAHDPQLMLSLIGKFIAAYHTAMLWGSREDRALASSLIREFASWMRVNGAAADEALMIVERAAQEAGDLYGR